jgi:hypothetical protein
MAELPTALTLLKQGVRRYELVFSLFLLFKDGKTKLTYEIALTAPRYVKVPNLPVYVDYWGR